jgi:hypothetical protein
VEAKIRGSMSRPSWAKATPISKITRKERAGGMAETVKCLLSKYKALSSKSSTAEID